MMGYQGKNTRTVNYLKAVHFDYPEWTPCSVGFVPAVWMKHREELEDIVLRYPGIFPDYRKGDTDFDDPVRTLYKPGRHVDAWGTVWENIHPGLDSIPVVEPLADWAAMDTWAPPDPLLEAEFEPRDWAEIRRGIEEARAKGDLARGGGLYHGCMFMRLYYLRGFENLMLDLATEDPRLVRLISIVLAYNTTVIGRYLEMGAEFMYFGDDLGTQKSLPISPDLWRKVMKPCYETMFGPCRDRGVPVYLHSDGHILEIIPDLVETGVRVIDPQIRANGLTGLQEVAKGRVAMNLDLDRQLLPFASPAQIDDHFHQVFEGLYLPEGGLMMRASCQPDVPLENIEAVCRSLQEICHPPPNA